MIDARKLGMLSALDRLGTIAAVAEELRLSAPGVSMQLASLEREIGVALTERRGRGVVLTPAGTVLAAHGRQILDRLALAELELDALRAGSVGRYAVTAFPSAARTFVADVIGSLVGGESRGLEFVLSTLEPEAAVDGLMTGSVHLAVIHSYSNVPRDVPDLVRTRMIGAEPVWLAVNAEMRRSTGHHRADLADYSDLPWIVPTPDVTCFGMVERACGLAGFRPKIVAESMDFGVQLELVAAGAGVALVPALTVDRVPHGVELLDLTAPIERSLLLAVREPSMGDAGIRRLSSLILDAASARLSTLRLR